MKLRNLFLSFGFAAALALFPKTAFADAKTPLVEEEPTLLVEEQASQPNNYGIQLLSLNPQNEYSPKLKSTTACNFIDRVELQPFAKKLYEILKEASDGDGDKDYLIEDKYFNPSLKLNYIHDYSDLKEDTVVTTGNNATAIALGGVNIPGIGEKSGSNYTAKALDLKSAVESQLYAAFTAFDRDCSEVFWLSSEHLVGMFVNGDMCYPILYLYHPTAGSNGEFSIRSEEFSSEDAIESRLKSFRAEVDKVVAAEAEQNPNSTDYEKVRYFNDWITNHNEYNYNVGKGNLQYVNVDRKISAAISAIPGSIGNDGPICEGYARALKIFCDKVGIPCCLSTGQASLGANAELHMWCMVELDGEWYGVDPTWNDPTSSFGQVPSASGAISGNERETYICVGSDTQTSSKTFAQERPNHTNQLFTGELAFTNEPPMAKQAYTPSSAQTNINTGDSGLSITLGKAGYTGSPTIPSKVVITYNDVPLKLGVDFVVEGYSNSQKPTGNLKIAFIGKYTNGVQIVRQFDIVDPQPISGTEVQGYDAKVTYSGKAYKPSITVSSSGSNLVLGEDYEVSYGDNISAGKGTITLHGLGVYVGDKEIEFDIEPKSVAELDFTGVDAEYTYAGEEIKPLLKAEFADSELQQTKDFNVSYEANTDASDAAKVKIQGVGNFGGEKELTFKIKPLDIASDTVHFGEILAQEYSGKGLTPAISASFKNKALETEKDYSVDYAENTGAGEATATVSGNGNFSGQKVLNFTISPADISKTSVEMDESAVSYTGSAITKEFTLSLGDVKLTSDDFDVVWSNNTDAGNAVGKISGKKNFQGEKTISFVISPLALADNDVNVGADDIVYTGSAIVPDVEVSHADLSLVKDKDFKVSAKNNVDAGIANVTVAGQGNYSGEIQKEFTISPFDISKIALGDVSDTYPWSESDTLGIEPKVEALDKTLVKDRDYELSVTLPEALGEGKVVVSGKGNFAGQAEKTFEVVAPVVSSPVELTSDVTSENVQYIWFSGDADDIHVEVSNPEVCEVKIEDVALSGSRVMKKVVTKPLGEGQATVKITGALPTETFEYSVDVQAVAEPKEATVTLSETKLDMKLGDEPKLVTIGGEGSNILTVDTDDDTIVEASIGTKGVTIKPLKVGHTKVTVTRSATDEFKEAKATIDVTVSAQSSSDEPETPGDQESNLDTSALEASLKKAEGLDGKAYTSSSWNTLSAAVSEAKSLLSNLSSGNITQTDVNNVAKKLDTAISALVPLDDDGSGDDDPSGPSSPDTPGTPGEPTNPDTPDGPGTPSDPDNPGTGDDESGLDLGKLQGLVDSLSDKDLTKYTKDSAEAFAKAYLEAATLLENPEGATQAEVDALVDELKKADADLVLLDSDGSTSGDNSSSGDNGSGSDNGSGTGAGTSTGTGTGTGTAGGQLNQSDTNGATASTSTGTSTGTNSGISSTGLIGTTSTGSSTTSTSKIPESKMPQTGIAAVVLPSLGVAIAAGLVLMARKKIERQRFRLQCVLKKQHMRKKGVCVAFLFVCYIICLRENWRSFMRKFGLAVMTAATLMLTPTFAHASTMGFSGKLDPQTFSIRGSSSIVLTIDVPDSNIYSYKLNCDLDTLRVAGDVKTGGSADFEVTAEDNTINVVCEKEETSPIPAGTDVEITVPVKATDDGEGKVIIEAVGKTATEKETGELTQSQEIGYIVTPDAPQDGGSTSTDSDGSASGDDQTSGDSQDDSGSGTAADDENPGSAPGEDGSGSATSSQVDFTGRPAYPEVYPYFVKPNGETVVYFAYRFTGNETNPILEAHIDLNGLTKTGNILVNGPDAKVEEDGDEIVVTVSNANDVSAGTILNVGVPVKVGSSYGKGSVPASVVTKTSGGSVVSTVPCNIPFEIVETVPDNVQGPYTSGQDPARAVWNTIYSMTVTNVQNAFEEAGFATNDWQSVEAALDAWSELMNSSASTNQELLKGYQDVMSAFDSLAQEPATASEVSALDAKIDAAKALRQGDYTPESWEAFSTVLSEVESARQADTEPGQASVALWTDQIDSAQQQLRTTSGSSSTTNTPTESTSTSTPVTNTTTTPTTTVDSTSKMPQTGMVGVVAPLAALGAAAGAALVVKKIRERQ